MFDFEQLVCDKQGILFLLQVHILDNNEGNPALPSADLVHSLVGILLKSDFPQQISLTDTRDILPVVLAFAFLIWNFAY